MIRLMVIEDHKTFISGLRYEIRSDRHDIEIAYAFDHPVKCLDTDPESFDVILLDLIIPETNPKKNIALLKKTFPLKPVVILTSETKSVWEIAARNAGADLFLTKHDTTSLLIESIKLAFQKGRKEHIFDEFVPSPEVNNISGKLNPSEREMIVHLSLGKSNKQIASDMNLSMDNTYKKLSRLRTKFKVTTNLGLIKLFKFRP